MASKRKKTFGQGSYSYDESHDEIAVIMGRVLMGLAMNDDYDVSMRVMARDAAKIAGVLSEAYIEMVDSFDEEAEEMVWELFLGNVVGAVANCGSDDIKSFDEDSDIVSDAIEATQAAWGAFAAEAGSDDDDEDEDEDDE